MPDPQKKLQGPGPLYRSTHSELLNSGERRRFPVTVPMTTSLHPFNHLCHSPESVSWGQLPQSLSPQIPTPPLPFQQALGASLAPPPALLTGPHPICVLSPSTHATSEDSLKTLPAPCILQDTYLLPTHKVCHKVPVRTELKNLFRIQIKFRP